MIRVPNPAPGAGSSMPRPLIPDADHQTLVVGPSADLEVAALRMAHRVCRGFGDCKLGVCDKAIRYTDIPVPAAHTPPRLETLATLHSSTMWSSAGSAASRVSTSPNLGARG